MLTCTQCGNVVLDFTPSEDELQSVVRALANGSKTIAADEFKYFARCSDEQAKTWVDHLLCCAYAWPAAQQDESVLEQIDQAFTAVDKPDHFTDFTHCDECKEHDDTLRARSRETLRRQDLGNCGWDPMTFSSAEGIGYFFPALARFALLPDVWRDHGWYGEQLVSHLSWDGSDNRFLAWCSPEQRRVVHALLVHLSATRTRAITQSSIERELEMALSAWQSGPPTVRPAAPIPQ